MPHVRYVGPSDAVELHVPGEPRPITCVRGAAVEVPAGLVAHLTQTGDWETERKSSSAGKSGGKE